LTRIFGRLTAWQNWIFQRPNAVGEKGALKIVVQRGSRWSTLQPKFTPTVAFSILETLMSGINYSEKIPNNVNLSEDRTLQRALEQWQPNFINWWDDMGPEGSTDMDVYLRTAVSVDPQGWAQFGHVKMRDYRWGVFMNPGEQDRKIHFGDNIGEKAWQDVPGEHRANLRRIIVTQG
ncbi:Uncharacterized protein APZ42_002374, partial [Daphnia magna]